MIRRLAHACFRHRLRVVIGWVVALIILIVASGAVGTGYSSDFTLPDVESKRGVDILEDQFGGQGAGQVGNIVFRAEQGVEDPPSARPSSRSWRRWRRSPNVQSVTSPYTSEEGAADRQ